MKIKKETVDMFRDEIHRLMVREGASLQAPASQKYVKCQQTAWAWQWYAKCGLEHRRNPDNPFDLYKDESISDTHIETMLRLIFIKELPNDH